MQAAASQSKSATAWRSSLKLRLLGGVRTRARRVERHNLNRFSKIVTFEIFLKGFYDQRGLCECRDTEFVHVNQAANGTLNWNSDVDKLQYIGGQYAGRLQQHNISTVGDVIEAVVDRCSRGTGQP